MGQTMFQEPKVVHSLLGLLENGSDVLLQFQILRDGHPQESEALHSRHRAAQDCEGVRVGGYVLRSTIISTVLNVLSSSLF